MRTVALPPWLVSRLLERQVNAVPNEWNVVFCSAMGKLRDTSNTTKHVRELLDEAGSTSAVGQTSRKTVVTWMDADRARRRARLPTSSDTIGPA
jgi:hypothetical protein